MRVRDADQRVRRRNESEGKEVEGNGGKKIQIGIESNGKKNP